METLTLSELIGETIHSIRYQYTNGINLQEFHSFIKLMNGLVIKFPIYDDEEFLELNKENLEFFNNSYNKGEELSIEIKDKIENQKIEDIFFCYFNQELDLDKRAYFKLSNGFYITEKSYGPAGLTDVSLLIFTQKEFEERVKQLDEELKSYINEIKPFANHT